MHNADSWRRSSAILYVLASAVLRAHKGCNDMINVAQ